MRNLKRYSFDEQESRMVMSHETYLERFVNFESGNLLLPPSPIPPERVHRSTVFRVES